MCVWVCISLNEAEMCLCVCESVRYVCEVCAVCVCVVCVCIWCLYVCGMCICAWCVRGVCGVCVCVCVCVCGIMDQICQK